MIVGYIAKSERLLLCDDDYSFVSFSVPISILQLFSSPDKTIEEVPEEWRGKVSSFLRQNGRLKEAFEFAENDTLKFEIALQMNDLDKAIEITKKSQSATQWQNLASMVLERGQLDLYEKCLKETNDNQNLLLLYSVCGRNDDLKNLAKESDPNIAFSALFASGEFEMCVDLLLNTGRYPEASIMARTYCPKKS